MKGKSTKPVRRSGKCSAGQTPERPRLNMDEVNFVLDLNASIVGAVVRIHKLETEMAELQAKVLVKPCAAGPPAAARCFG